MGAVPTCQRSKEDEWHDAWACVKPTILGDLDDLPLPEPMHEPDINVPAQLESDVASSRRQSDASIHKAVSRVSEECCSIVVLGSSGVGKTLLVHSILSGLVPKNIRDKGAVVLRSEWVPYATKYGTQIRLSTFECDTSARATKAAKLMCKVETNVFLLCFDLLVSSSFDEVVKKYMPLIPLESRHRVMLVGLKRDLIDRVSSKRAVKRSHIVACEEDSHILYSMELACLEDSKAAQKKFLDNLRKLLHDDSSGAFLCP